MTRATRVTEEAVGRNKTMSRAVRAALQFGIDYPPSPKEVEKLIAWDDDVRPWDLYLSSGRAKRSTDPYR